MSSNLVDLVEFESVKRAFNKPRFCNFKENEIEHWNMAIGTLFYLVYDDARQTIPGENMDFIDRLEGQWRPIINNLNFLGKHIHFQ